MNPSIRKATTGSTLVCHSGKQHAYRHALSLQQLGRLALFVTSGYFKPSRFPDSLFDRIGKVSRGLRLRHLDGLDESKVRRRWSLEVPELLARKFAPGSNFAENLIYRRDARFDRWVASMMPRLPGDIYWGFQGSCFDSLVAARSAGKPAVVEFATAHVTAAKRILSEESAKHPEWSATISNLHFPEWYERRLIDEPHRGDVCVSASGFTTRSLIEAGVAAEKIKTLPLGADVDQFPFSKRGVDGPFRALFVGGIGQRKGIKYLLEAVKKLRSPNVELVLAGPLGAAATPLKAYHSLYRYVGKLTQAEVSKLMRTCHVLVLPSVFEGFGLVIPEAMATGMPVIASDHSIGPEMIDEGETGFVIKPWDVDRLADRLDRLASRRAEAVEMGVRASRRAQEFSWDAHRRRLGELLALPPFNMTERDEQGESA
jgi:glycosyltransferase involved in cell wall biosynthesis